MLPSRRVATLIVAAGLSAGCAGLLPKASEEVHSPWHSFDEAKTAIERIRPDNTSVAELKAMGIDPYASPNVQILTYSDIVLRFPITGTIAPEHLDPGLRRCLEAGKACVGYYLNVRDVKRDRVGSFWADAFGFKRTVDVSGWSFNALILVVDEHVVYTLYGGQPIVREQEVKRQPLGPLQSFGESVGALAR